MKISWEITKDDIEKVRSFYEIHKMNELVKMRQERNVEKIGIDLSRESYWKALVMCLLTTQQRSGPNSKVNTLLNTMPFPLMLNICLKSNHLATKTESVLTKFGGIRRAATIGRELEYNLSVLSDDNWKIISTINAALKGNDDYEQERKFSLLLAENLRGIGPKQSRNYLQMLGLTKYEIPLDSRIMKWLNDFGFPVKLSATSLSDHPYYNFVLDGFRTLARKAGIYPCLMDAAIFSSFDKDGLTRENSAF